jgi:hypothetical protein
MNQQLAPIPAPLKAAVGNITTGTNALAASNTGNKNLAAGVNLSGNLARVNTNNTKAANAFNMGVKNINKTLNMTNLNQKLKNNLVTAQKHFTTAAINAAANQPIKAANHARRGIGALKNYIGSNLTNM